MGHDGDVFALASEFGEKSQNVGRIGICDEAIRPERQGLRADSNCTQMLELGIGQRSQVFLESGCLHDHWIAAGHEQVCNLFVALQVFVQRGHFTCGDAQILVLDELGPAETEGAIGMARLTMAGEEQQGVSQIIALLLYGSGLRMLECLRLRVKDIDFNRRELTVRQGKGDTYRRTMLPESASEQLRTQIEVVRRLAYQMNAFFGEYFEGRTEFWQDSAYLATHKAYSRTIADDANSAQRLKLCGQRRFDGRLKHSVSGVDRHRNVGLRGRDQIDRYSIAAEALERAG